MAISLTRPLNQHDVFRIVSDVDQPHLGTLKNEMALDEVIVITQLARKLHSALPIEIVDEIMRRHLENSPSVGFLLGCYKNTFVLSFPSPLAENTALLNGASRFVLLKLKEIPQPGEPACYQQLMISVFKLHFETLTVDQRIELIQRSDITPWEQKSPGQKLELLGRVQAPTLGGQAKFKLQILSWKIQFAAVRALENNIIVWSVSILFGIAALSTIPMWVARFSPTFASSATYQAYIARLKPIYICGLIIMVTAIAISLISALIGFILKTSNFPAHIREKGEWIQTVSLHCFFLSTSMLLTLVPGDTRVNNKSIDFKQIEKTSKDLQTLLLQSINQANITVGQERFIEAHLPELLTKWQFLTNTLPKEPEK